MTSLGAGWAASSDQVSQPRGVGRRAGHVLVADDDPAVRAYDSAVLKSLGYRVTAVKEASEAMQVIDSREDIDLLVTDVVMPAGMNGRELAIRATAARPGLRVLITSGFAVQISASTFDKFPHFLAKPYRRAEFEAAVIAAIAPAAPFRGGYGGALVYVVDSDSVRRRTTSVMLSTAGLTPHPYLSSSNFLGDVPNLLPGCVVLDSWTPEGDNIALISLLGERRNRLPVVAVTNPGDVITAVRAMKAGASDVIERPFDESVLLETLDPIFSFLGQQVLTGERTAQAREQLSRLTRRQTDILRGLVNGLSNKQLAFELNLSVRTVEVHRARMMDRLGVKAVPEALRLVFDAADTRFRHS